MGYSCILGLVTGLNSARIELTEWFEGSLNMLHYSHSFPILPEELSKPHNFSGKGICFGTRLT